MIEHDPGLAAVGAGNALHQNTATDLENISEAGLKRYAAISPFIAVNYPQQRVQGMMIRAAIEQRLAREERDL